MSKKVNPTIIGVFIVVGLFLTIGGILIFSSSKWFTKTREYVLYFDASLTGLDTGAPVKFRGVTVGAVKEVLIHHNQQPTDQTLPVIVVINEDLLNEKTDATLDGIDHAEIKVFIQRGLRGRLETQSLLTGLLYINLEFLPETPITYHQLKPTREEIPTAPNQLQVFIDDFATIAQDLGRVMKKLEAGLGDLQMKALSTGITNLIASLNKVVSSPDLTNILFSTHRTVSDLQQTVEELRPRLHQLVASADQTLAESRATIGTVKDAAGDLQDMLAPRGSVRGELTGALEQIATAARAVTTLAELLNQHPNALISGRRSETKQ